MTRPFTRYACVSPRTDEKTFRDVCQRLRYEAVAFRSVDEGGSAIYHTNVMMWVGTRAAGVCLESVVGEKERKPLYIHTPLFIHSVMIFCKMFLGILLAGWPIL